MSFFLILLGLMFALDALWWWLSAHLAKRKAWRRVIMVFMGAQVIGLAWLISGRILQTGWDRWLPKFAVSAIFLWHFLGLAALLGLGLVALPILVVRALTRLSKGERPPQTDLPNDSRGWSRRDFIAFTAAMAPPLFTLSLTGIAIAQLRQFRVRRFIVPLPGLPGDLDGLTIAHVSDMHVGRFTSARVLGEMVNVVNAMRADLVLLTGDLINDALADLDSGLDLVRSLDPRLGLYLIEGNHDLIENGLEFERRVKASGVPFLLDDSAIIDVRGFPLQLLGLSWTRARENRDQAISVAVKKLLQQRNPEAFSLLLAHHPHAFDAAAEAGVPLTLSGHTHGGQLMLNEQLGFGPAMFRYWSGLYARDASKLIVSNGVGNWFPVRTNAPAEIVHLTLRRS